MTTRTKAILGLSGIFLLGLLCGGLGVGIFVRENVRDRERLRDAEGFREYFADRLSLSESQRDSLTSELQTAYEELADIRAMAESEYDLVFDTLASRINPVLSPDQRLRLEEQRLHLLPRDRISKRGRAIRFRLRSAPETDSSLAVPDEADWAMEDAMPEGAPADVPKEKGGKDSAAALKAESDATEFSGLPGPETSEEELPTFVEFLKTRLELDGEQTGELQHILRKAVRRNAWIRENFKDDRLQRTRRLRGSLAMLDRQLTEILTGSQRDLYRTLKRDMKAKRRKSASTE